MFGDRLKKTWKWVTWRSALWPCSMKRTLWRTSWRRWSRKPEWRESLSFWVGSQLLNKRRLRLKEQTNEVLERHCGNRLLLCGFTCCHCCLTHFIVLMLENQSSASSNFVSKLVSNPYNPIWECRFKRAASEQHPTSSWCQGIFICPEISPAERRGGSKSWLVLRLHAAPPVWTSLHSISK